MVYILITILVLAGIKFSIKPLQRMSNRNNILGKLSKWLIE